MRRIPLLLLALVVFCALVVFASAYRRAHPSHVDLETLQPQESAGDSLRQATLETGSTDVAPQRDPSRQTATKSMPSISRIRASEIEWVGGQTIESLTADLGNAIIQSHRSGNDPVPSQIGYWNNALTRSPVALRLIEESAAHPDQVTQLLLQEAKLAINEYPRARENLASRVPQSTSLGDEHYRTTHRYQDPAIEWNRLHLEMYGAFYVIANLGRLNEDAKPTLAAFLKLPLTNSYDCLDLKVWLIDAYYHQAGLENSAFGKSHHERVGNTDLFGPKVLRSRWNAPVDRDQFLLTATGADVSGVSTIEIFALPDRLAMKKPQKSEIIDNFVKYASGRADKL